MHRPLIAVLLVVLAGACARPYPPPGGERDTAPPGLVSTSPVARTRLTDLDATAVITFDERLRSRTFNRTFVSVMPGDPDDFQIELKGNEIHVKREGGWVRDQIYHVVVRPGLEDLFNNKRTAPVELVFSTGPDVPPTALAGAVVDRVTGQGARDAVIEAVRRTDSTVYRTVADSVAFFALRHTPYGAYDVRAYSDRNRNQRLDAGEPRSGVSLVSLGQGADTVTVTFELLPGDTTGPRLVRAEAVDSLHVRLTFDDPIDAEYGLGGAAIEFYRLPDSTAVGSAARVVLARAFEAERARSRPAADTTAAVGRDSVRVAPPARPGQPPQQPAKPVPEQGVVATLNAPLAPGQYVARAAGVRNVNNLVGGGSTRFTVRDPRAAADSTAIRR